MRKFKTGAKIVLNGSDYPHRKIINIVIERIEVSCDITRKGVPSNVA